jgi:hypothetical protein
LFTHSFTSPSGWASHSPAVRSLPTAIGVQQLPLMSLFSVSSDSVQCLLPFNYFQFFTICKRL